MKLYNFFKLILIACVLSSFHNCKKAVEETSEVIAIADNTESKKLNKAQPLSQEFKDYWYAGKAEITSFQLEQARYGETRNGKAVLVYVTEDFLPEEQVKADTYKESNIPVLKLNATKNFNTGIYPYSIMQSTFFPVANNQHALKVSASIQEWCGHVYTQLNNRSQFEINSHSYFQSEADQNITLEKAITENELWTQLRVDPKSLPTGSLNIIPSLEYLRLKHQEVKSYRADASMKKGQYIINYPDLNRTLTINFNQAFPYDIIGWEESFKSGFGANSKTMTTTATRLESIKSAYWGKNSNADESLRETLKLE